MKILYYDSCDNLLSLASLAFFLNSADLLVLAATWGEDFLVFKHFGLGRDGLQTMQFVSEKRKKVVVLVILTGDLEIANTHRYWKNMCCDLLCQMKETKQKILRITKLLILRFRRIFFFLASRVKVSRKFVVFQFSGFVKLFLFLL